MDELAFSATDVVGGAAGVRPAGAATSNRVPISSRKTRALAHGGMPDLQREIVTRRYPRRVPRSLGSPHSISERLSGEDSASIVANVRLAQSNEAQTPARLERSVGLVRSRTRSHPAIPRRGF